jgi:hypothetical protein
MATLAPSPTAPTPASVWAGRVLSGLAIAFLVFDAGIKIAQLEVVGTTGVELGWTGDLAFWRNLGLLLLGCTALYAWPRTALLGAVLLTGYIGGAIATHVRIGNPLFTHTLFGVYLALMIWGGLWLRHPGLRSVFPLDNRKD